MSKDAIGIITTHLKNDKECRKDSKFKPNPYYGELLKAATDLLVAYNELVDKLEDLRYAQLEDDRE